MQRYKLMPNMLKSSDQFVLAVMTQVSFNFHFDILLSFQTAVPTERTSYICRAFEIPKVNETHHIVMVRSIELK